MLYNNEPEQYLSENVQDKLAKYIIAKFSACKLSRAQSKQVLKRTERLLDDFAVIKPPEVK